MNVTVFKALQEEQVGAKCCGSLDKLRCHDGSKDAAGLASSGSTCLSADAFAAPAAACSRRRCPPKNMCKADTDFKETADVASLVVGGETDLR